MSIRILAPAIIVTGLAACGGTTSSGSETGRISNGVLENIELPSNESLAEFPQEIQDLVNGFASRNESNARTETLPTARATYTGNLGFALDNEDRVAAGTLQLIADFDASSVGGGVTDLTGSGPDGPVTLGGTLNVSAGITGPTIEGTITGTIEDGTDLYNVNGGLQGVFGGSNAEVLLGSVDGSIILPDGSRDGIDGFFSADKD